MSAPFVQLWLVTDPPGSIVVPAATLVLDGDNRFVLPQIAEYVTLVDPVDPPLPSGLYTAFNAQHVTTIISMQSTKIIRVYWRNQIEDNPGAYPGVITANDPTGGKCLCGISCNGTSYGYLPVIPVIAPAQ